MDALTYHLTLDLVDMPPDLGNTDPVARAILARLVEGWDRELFYGPPKDSPEGRRTPTVAGMPGFEGV